MAALSWPCPLPGGGTSAEMALLFEADARDPAPAPRPLRQPLPTPFPLPLPRLLIVPALLDEGSRMRRFTVEVMRRLAGAGVTCILPDLPGTNESLAPLAAQTPGDWQLAMAGAAAHFELSHVLAIRGGALVAPRRLPGWRYAATTGAAQLRQLLRARILGQRELGVTETQEALLAQGRAEGLELGGMRLSADFITEFVGRVPEADSLHADIAQDMLGGGGDLGGGLWLRAEPGEDRAQADALAAIVAVGLSAATGPESSRS